jgi:hypothetical protein
MEQAFDFSRVQSFDEGEDKITTHLLRGGKISIQGASGGPIDDVTEPFSLDSLPASLRRELTTHEVKESVARIVAKIARQYAVEDRCRTLLL